MTELSATPNDVPDVSSTGINGSAKMLWQAVQATPSFNYSTVGKYHGIPGRYWQGAVNPIINELWPALNDRYLTEKEQADEIRLTLNRFLRHNKAMVCTRDGGVTKKSLWFVAKHWPELTVVPGNKEKVEEHAPAVVTDAAATASPTTVGVSATPLDVFNLSRPAAPAVTEIKEESTEAMTPTFQEPVVDSTAVVDEDDSTVKYGCRHDDCTETFAGVHHRATHEMKHGMRVNEDGTITSFDPNAPTPDEEQVHALIVQVCTDREPMNQEQIIEEVRKISPKVSSPTIRIVLQVMVDEKWFEIINKVEGQKGRVRKFNFLGEPVKRAKKKAAVKPLAMAVEEKLDEIIVKQESGGFIETAIASLRGDADESRVSRYRSLLEDLEHDLALMDAMKREIEQLRRANADLQLNIDAICKQRDEALAKAANSEELERVTRERDELQGKLDTLRQIFA